MNNSGALERSQSDSCVAVMKFCRDCLQELLDLENSIELMRKELSYRHDFTLAAFFDIFARSLQHKVSVDEF